MAERLETYDWSARRSTLYPWDEWADGSIWRVKQGEDFKVATPSFAATLRARAKALDRTVNIKIEQDSRPRAGSDVKRQGIVVFQFHRARTPTPTDRIGRAKRS